MSSRERPSVTTGAGRLESFSDAVMAVIITILALELRPPEHPTWAAVRDWWPDLFIYLLAFVFIAIYWNNHHHLLRATDRISGVVMWANLTLLFWLSLAPVVTDWIRSTPREALPVASFGVVALGAGLSYRWLVGSLIRANGRDSTVGQAVASDVKGYVSLGLYALALAFAVVSVWISYALYAAVAVIWLIPDRRFTRLEALDEGD
jgi:uncharacterized membrane protein